MKRPKLLALIVMTGVMMVSTYVGSASATELDCGESMCTWEQQQQFFAQSEGALTLHLPFGNINCSPSIEGRIENTGSSTETVTILVTKVEAIPCVVIMDGRLLLHTDANDSVGNSGNGTVTWSNFEFTIESSGFHCKFSTNNTDLGTVTGSKTTGSRAVIDVAAQIPRTGGRSGAFCGSTAEWTGSLRIETPSSLIVT